MTPAPAQPLDPDAVRAQTSAPKSPHARFAAQPSGPNPYLSFLPTEAKPDYPAWQAWLREQGKAKRVVQAPIDPTKLIGTSESEPNDTPATANAVAGFGTGIGEDPAADVTGALAGGPPPTIIGPFAEDDGSIPLAVITNLSSGTAVRTSGTIGDGPYGGAGTGSGDFDFFLLGTLAAGDEILIDVDTPMPFCCDLDPFVTIVDASGSLLAFNDDQPTGGTYDSYLVYSVPAAGTYYVIMGAYQSPFPANLFDSSSGTGSASEGTYDVTIGVNILDRDHFSLALEPGDVVSGNLLGGSGTRVTVVDPTGVERVGSGQNINFILPGPFPQGGAVGFAYVAETPGAWKVKVSGGVPGAYTLELRAFRPNLELSAGVVQKLFVDFDGATVDPSIFGGSPGAVALSPLASFLAGWGLTPADESALIDGVLAEIEESLSTDMRVLALNGDFDVTGLAGDFDLMLLNSRDHADPVGDPNVSRLVVGGTINELQIGTIGIASAIDPGNFSTDDTAVVLLDLLSGPSNDPNSLNQFALGGGATQLELVATGVGNIAAHEAGHFFSSFHTSQVNAQANVMDQGGNLANTVGVGPDLTFGTGDDVDVDFGPDQYVPNEGFTGSEDTLNATAFGLSTGILDCPVLPSGSCRVAGKSTLQLKDKLNDKQDALTFSWLNGAGTTFAELGAPLGVTEYRVCVYDAGGLVRSAIAPAAGLCRGKPCWKQTGPISSPNGYVYRDPDLTPDGTSTVVLKSGVTTKSKVQWKAKGLNLDDGSLGLVPPVVVEVRTSDTPACFGQTFGAPDITTNTAVELKAKAD